MKKWILLTVVGAVLLTAATTAFAVSRNRQAEADRAARELEESLSRAEEIHESLHSRYLAALEALDESRVTVTENGRKVGDYTLEELGLAGPARSAVIGTFDASDHLSEEAFAAMPQGERLAQLDRADFRPAAVTLTGDALNCAALLEDLDAMPRRPAEDCRPAFTGKGFTFQKEKPGTEIDAEKLKAGLKDSLEGTVFSGEPLSLTFELRDCDPYLAPAVTLENQKYDLGEVLVSTLRERDYELHVDLWGTEEILDTAACTDLLAVKGDGCLALNREPAAALVARWAEQYDAGQVPYYFNSYSAGKVSLPFLKVTCHLNQEAMLERLEQALCCLTDDVVDAPFDCTDRAGRPVSFSGTYIEVDIARQTMTCFQDGNLLVTTPVVTGRPAGHMTPSGSYRVQSKAPNRWLTGPDYQVFVYYWLGFNGAYGIHDAKWRSAFGEKLYEYNGSHGCVNTPTEAMEQIYNCAEVGTPVVVFNIP